MGYNQAKAAIEAANLADDAARLAWATAPIYAVHFVSYRTFDAMFGKAKTDAVQAWLAAYSARYDAYMSNPGDETGSGGGVDLSLEATRALIAALVAQSVILQADADALLALSPQTGSRFQSWGLNAFTADDFAHLADLAKWEGLSNAANGVLACLDASASGAAVLMGSPDVSARRAALVAAVADWRAKIDAGDASVPTMPATAADLWAAVIGA